MNDLSEIFLAECDVESLGIFGMYVLGEQANESRLDLLVDFNRLVGTLDFVGL